jgi:hypothetical protein
MPPQKSAKRIEQNARANRMRAAMRQVRTFLKRQGLRTDGKVGEVIRRFADQAGLECTHAPRRWLLDLWSSMADERVAKVMVGFSLSAEWLEIRRFVLDRDGPTCRICGTQQTPSVDHILPRSLYPELALVPSNLQVLCRSCNSRKGARI